MAGFPALRFGVMDSEQGESIRFWQTPPLAGVELLTARTRGLAQLESARAETAALRTLANGAKILEDHPALAKLRMVQAIPMGSSLSLRVDDES